VPSRFAELDRRSTPIGELSLRRRVEPTLQVDVYEARLGDEFLMSSLFTVAEIELAVLALDQATGSDLDVVVGGLGLGYTARAVLDDDRVRSLHVVEALRAVIEWHERGLVPLAPTLTSDGRCRLVEGDFFGMAAAASGFGPGGPERWHVILVDIDHSPSRHLHPGNAAFYEPDGLRRLVRHLHPGGVFGLWSDDSPDEGFLRALDGVFASCEAHIVTFPNHLTGGEASNTVYVARAAGPSGSPAHRG